MSDSVHVFKGSHDIYVAVSYRHGYYGRHLEGFGRYILADYKKRGVDVDDVEFSLSADLIPHYPLCPQCKGAGRVEASGTLAGQYLSSEFDDIDFSKTGTKTCLACRGMGVTIADFF